MYSGYAYVSLCTPVLIKDDKNELGQVYIDSNIDQNHSSTVKEVMIIIYPNSQRTVDDKSKISLSYPGLEYCTKSLA